MRIIPFCDGGGFVPQVGRLSRWGWNRAASQRGKGFHRYLLCPELEVFRAVYK